VNRIAGVIRMHHLEPFSLYILPWLILGSSFIINLILGYSIGDAMYSGGIASIFVYMFVVGIIVIAQTFVFAVGFSVRRKDFFWGTLATVGIVGALKTILLAALGYVEAELTGGWGVGLHFFSIPYLSVDNVFINAAVYFGLIVNLNSLGMTFACVYRRFGIFGTLIFSLGVPLLLSVGAVLATYFRLWGQVLDWLVQHTMFELTLWMLPLTLVYIVACYFMMRKSEA